MVWRVAPSAEFRWRHWDDESVLYDPRSGQTHLLTALAADVLLALEEAAGDAPELAAMVARQRQLDPAPELTGDIAALLQQLDDLGLIERVPDQPG